MADPNEVAVLIGNGLSIAYNKDLALGRLTENLLEKLDSDDESDAVVLMRSLASQALPEGVTSDDDFEKLVGVLDLESSSLNHVKKFASVRHRFNPELTEAVDRVRGLLEETRDIGVSHVLQAVTENSKAGKQEFSAIVNMIDSICEDFDRSSFANLNYDTLLLAALLKVNKDKSRKFADLFKGNEEAAVDLGNDRLVSHNLRDETDSFFDDAAVRLVHLHGSVTYWDSPQNSCSKIDRHAVEKMKIWKDLRDQKHDFRPCVVLTNSQLKRGAIQRQPFRRAYDEFSKSINRAECWLIIGYSFRDEPVNDALSKEFLKRDSDERPKVLVVTNSDRISRNLIEEKFGWGIEDGSSQDWLRIDRDGAFGLESRIVWNEFIDCAHSW